MRIVHSPNEFIDAFLGAQREAAASFGISTILLEKYITQPRHIEVQVFFFGFIVLSNHFSWHFVSCNVGEPVKLTDIYAIIFLVFPFQISMNEKFHLFAQLASYNYCGSNLYVKGAGGALGF